MIQIDLDGEERAILRESLETLLSDLRMEIADTDRMAFRDRLKRRKAIIQKVIDALGGTAPADR